MEVERYIHRLAATITSGLKRLHENGEETYREVKRAREDQTRVADILSRITTTLSCQATTSERPSLVRDQEQLLLDALQFDQINARQMAVKRAHPRTCRWLLQTDEYRNWLELSKLGEHHGFIWIKGKLGTGKSTLMKFLVGNSQTTMKDAIITSFFFNARGEALEKTTTGMYRSLLLQLLTRRPELQDGLDSFGLAIWENQGSKWSNELLKSLFERAVLGLGQSLVCFIDGLDECNERQVRDMVSFFGHLEEMAVSAGIQFRLCFSSRHYPHITVAKGLDLTIEGQQGHDNDIVSYLNSELKIGHSKLAEQIRAELQEKASGVFMWVVLVVEILNKEHDRGHIHELRQRLRDIPLDLHELFRDILTRDDYNYNSGPLLLCIQWILFARSPLRPAQLYFAILSGAGSAASSRWDHDEITAAVIQRFILDSSKGLAEITTSECPTVQFIHESVRDFLLEENGLQEISKKLGESVLGESHERLKQCCLAYLMGIDIVTSLNITGSLPRASSREVAEFRRLANAKFPFLEYSTRNILYHADRAEEGGVSQTGFVKGFQLTDWIKLDNLFERHEVRRYSSKASFLYILAACNLAALIRSYPYKQSCFAVEDERYGSPILAALAPARAAAVAAFLQVLADSQPEKSLHTEINQYSAISFKDCRIGRDFTFSHRRGTVSHFAEHGHASILAFLLAQGDVDIEMRDDSGRTPLSWAARNGHEAVVQQLIHKIADVEAKDDGGRTPLSWAAANGHEAAVQLLLENRANVEAKDDGSGWTPLLYATPRGQEALVQLLLDNGANIEAQDDDGWTSLSWAAAKGHTAVLRLLLDRGANIEHQSNDGRTPLSWAAAKGREAAARLLLDSGADAAPKNHNLRTPVAWAAAHGH